jgi:hypothetical protein
MLTKTSLKIGPKSRFRLKIASKRGTSTTHYCAQASRRNGDGAGWALHVLELLDAALAEAVLAADKLEGIQPRLEADVAHVIMSVVSSKGKVGHPI